MSTEVGLVFTLVCNSRRLTDLRGEAVGRRAGRRRFSMRAGVGVGAAPRGTFHLVTVGTILMDRVGLVTYNVHVQR